VIGMPLKQVGVVAKRAPDGSFLPAIPLYRDCPEQTKFDEQVQTDIEAIFIKLISKYRDEIERGTSQ